MTSRFVSHKFARNSVASAAAFIAAGSFFLACSGMGDAAPTSDGPVSYVKTVHGKSFVVANGRPYLMYGVQMRIDHVIGDDYAGLQSKAPIIEQYFEHAKSVGFRTVVVPVRWSYIEPTEGKYDFSYVDMIIDDAKANGQDLQLLWYGSDVCGFNLVPGWVVKDKVRFPRSATNDTFYDLSNTNLISHEKAAVAAMMAHIATYDTTDRVIIVQVENEPDGAGTLTSSLKWGDAADMTAKMFACDQFAPAVALMDTLGKVIHNSARNVVTRCNIGTNYRALDVYNARPKVNPGVDIYGVDTYSLDPAETKKALSIIPNNAGNVSHQPEGGGKAGNLVNLILSDFEEGGGSLIYELRGLEGDNGIYRKPAYLTGETVQGDMITQTTTGVTVQGATVTQTTTAAPDLSDWTERDGSELLWNKQPENKTSEIRAFNTLVYKANQEIAMVPKGNCAAFNVDDHVGHWTETKTIDAVPVTFETWNGASAFAMKDSSGALVLMNLTDGNVFTLDPSYVHGADVSVGYFDGDDKWNEQYRKPYKGNTLLMWKGDVVRIPVASKPV